MNNNSHKGMSPLTAGMTGLVIGAVGTAVGIVMSNKDNRKKVQKKAQEVSDWGNKKIHDIKTTTNDSLETAESKMKEIRKDVKSDSNNRTPRTNQK